MYHSLPDGRLNEPRRQAKNSPYDYHTSAFWRGDKFAELSVREVNAAGRRDPSSVPHPLRLTGLTNAVVLFVHSASIPLYWRQSALALVLRNSACCNGEFIHVPYRVVRLHGCCAARFCLADAGRPASRSEAPCPGGASGW